MFQGIEWEQEQYDNINVCTVGDWGREPWKERREEGEGEIYLPAGGLPNQAATKASDTRQPISELDFGDFEWGIHSRRKLVAWFEYHSLSRLCLNCARAFRSKYHWKPFNCFLRLLFRFVHLSQFHQNLCEFHFCREDIWMLWTQSLGLQYHPIIISKLNTIPTKFPLSNPPPPSDFYIQTAFPRTPYKIKKTYKQPNVTDKTIKIFSKKTGIISNNI